ncbi:MAG TPA: hypothetical protein DCL08_07430 [Anaerolineaceae bacterium]|nr:hypothetical protein [Anaerolineaceae bacterium]
MSRSRKMMVILTILIIISGWALFMLLNKGLDSEGITTSFQAWFWDQRGLDLIVQVLLVFSGALGIAAILPIEDEENE